MIFVQSYNLPKNKKSSLSPFIEKLNQKNQPNAYQKQASHAIQLYYRVIQSPSHEKPRVTESNPNGSPEQRDRENHTANSKQASVPTATGYPPSQANPHIAQWHQAKKALSDEIKVRHYSPKTLKAYSDWVSKFQFFVKNKRPDELSDTDYKGFLTFLAVQQGVSASTQNQAFSALLFFYRNVLKKDPGEIQSVRAKQNPYIPVVLTQKEIIAIIRHLAPPYDLVVKILYGCGLRLFECLQLRVGDFNFDGEILFIRDGKGKKDRTVPLPRKIRSELLAHRERIAKLHEKDLEQGYAGAFMFGQPENRAKELIWQWFFPGKRLPRVPETGELRRYHLHERHVQRAIKKAVEKARVDKRVSSHTFRHSFATHLLQANYDIRTIQEL